MADAALVQCTFYGNAAPEGGNISSDCGAHISLANSIVASSQQGVGFYVDGSSSAVIACSDIHGNADGDWVFPIGGLLGLVGNICEDPRFCDPAGGDFTLNADSPCLPDSGNDCGLMGAFGLGCGVSDVDAPIEFPADRVRLVGNYPNPFNPRTTIRFDLPARAEVSLQVFDLSGRRVRVLITAEDHGPGRHEIAWDGTDDAGYTVASGQYLYRLGVGGDHRTKRMTLTR